MKLNLKTKGILTSLLQRFSSLSVREKLLIYSATTVLAFMLLYSGLGIVAEAFRAQQQEYKKAQDSLEALPYVITRYGQLHRKIETIRELYSTVELGENEVPPIIESKIKEIAGITAGVSIRPLSNVAFGDQYRKDSYRVQNIIIQDYPKFVKFLRELTHGQQRFLIESILINRYRGRSQLQAELTVSGVRRTSP